MPFVYGSLPIGFSTLKSLYLVHPDYNSGTPSALAFSAAGDYLGFEACVTALNSALATATGSDLSIAWSESNKVCQISSAADKTWFIPWWPARGFFGFEYPVDKWRPTGTAPAGALYFDGLSVESIDASTAHDGREKSGDGYSLIKGQVLNLKGYTQLGNIRTSQNIAGGAGSVLDWMAYKGRISCQPTADAGAFSLSNLDGKLTDVELIGYSSSGKEAFMGAEVWTVDLKVQI
jgi:hypothetical protein